MFVPLVLIVPEISQKIVLVNLEPTNLESLNVLLLLVVTTLVELVMLPFYVQLVLPL